MDRSKTLGVISIFAAVLALIVGIWGMDGAMIALSCFAIFFSVMSTMRCSEKVQQYSVIMSVTMLICTILAVTVVSYGSLVKSEILSENQWSLVCGIVQGVAVIPMIPMFFFVAAAFFKASFNWVMMPGLGWLVGMGFQLPKNLSVRIFQLSDIMDGIMTNNGIVIIMFVGLIMFIAFSLILRSIFKKNQYLITADGLVVRQ